MVGSWLVGVSVVGGFNKTLADVCGKKIFPLPNQTNFVING